MAMRTTILTCGIDVARDWLDIDDGDEIRRIDNTRASIRDFLRGLGNEVQLAVEPTNRFHVTLVQLAVTAGHTVYLVDPYRLSRYRESVGVRAKTDTLDARLLRRYLLAEAANLRAYQPPPKAVQALSDLLRARAKLVETRTALALSLKHIKSLSSTRQALLCRIDQAIAVVDRKLQRRLREAGYAEDYRRCLTIPGVGPLNATALVATFRRGHFHNADAFISFLGLDVRVRESGQYKGQRKLTKRGNPELRRLLFNGARAGSLTPQWNAYYHELKARGLASTAATVAIARKIARLAFALLRDQTTFENNLKSA